MRSLWIATGVIIVVLALAAALKPNSRDEAGIGDGNNGRSLAPNEVNSDPSMSADDLNRIMELRAEFGSAADQLGGEKIAPAAFEQKLRQLAGLSESTPATIETAGDTGQVTAAQVDRRADLAANPIFRQAAATLDDAADDAEEAGDYGRADHLRSLGGELRRLARPQNSRGGEAFSPAEDVANGLIDKSQSRQAQ